MKINVASLNPQKIQAVKDLALQYEILKDATIEGVSVPSGVSEQPRNLEDSADGAMNRAKNAFVDCDYSFGIENGLIKVPKSEHAFMDICVCAIYDGSTFSLGFSSTFEIPKKMMDFVDEHTDLSAACRKAGFTEEEKIGTVGGVVGLLSNNRVDRLEQVKQAVVSAMVRLEHKEFF